MKHILVLFLALSIGAATFAEDNHEGEEQNASVGPDKGIMEAHEDDGFKLSAEAIKNFEIETKKISNSPPWGIPISARLVSGEEINIYRLRQGFYKRIDFTLVSKAGENMNIKSADLKAGDEVVIHGVGLLRAAELVAFGGEPEGHGH